MAFDRDSPRHDRLSHHAVSCRSGACREYFLEVDSTPPETAARRGRMADCRLQTTRRRTTAAAPTMVPIKSHQSHGIMTLPPGGGIVHLRSGLLRGGVRGLNVLDDGGVKSDRYHDCCSLPSVSLSSVASIGDDASVQISLGERAAYNNCSNSSLSKSARVHAIQVLAYHSLTHCSVASCHNRSVIRPRPLRSRSDKLDRGHGPVRPYMVGLNDVLVLAGWDRGPAWNTLDT